jgi:hypothetical protein
MGNCIEIVREEEQLEFKLGDSIIYFRRISNKHYKEIVAKHTFFKGNDRAGNPKYERDDDAINEELLDYIITGFVTIRDPITKKNVECTLENKNSLPVGIRIQIIERANGDMSAMAAKGDAEKKTSEDM